MGKNMENNMGVIGIFTNATALDSFLDPKPKTLNQG